MAREVKTAYGVMTAEKTAKGYTVTAPCGTHIGEVEVYKCVKGNQYESLPASGGARAFSTLKEACNYLASVQWTAAREAEKAEIEAAAADAQAAEQVAAESIEYTIAFESAQDACRVCGGASKDGEALVHDYLCDNTNNIAQQDKLATRRATCKKCGECGHSWKPAKRIAGKPDGSAEVTTADGVTTIAPRNEATSEHEQLEQAHGVRITSPDIPASGVDAEYYVDKDNIELGKIYFVEGAGYAPMRRDYKWDKVTFYSVCGKMRPTMGEALQQLLDAVKEHCMPDNAHKVRIAPPQDATAQAQAQLAKVDSLIALNKWWFDYGAEFDLFFGHGRVAAFGAFKHPQYIYVIANENKNLVLNSQIGATLTARPK